MSLSRDLVDGGSGLCSFWGLYRVEIHCLCFSQPQGRRQRGKNVGCFRARSCGGIYFHWHLLQCLELSNMITPKCLYLRSWRINGRWRGRHTCSWKKRMRILETSQFCFIDCTCNPVCVLRYVCSCVEYNYALMHLINISGPEAHEPCQSDFPWFIKIIVYLT